MFPKLLTTSVLLYLLTLVESNDIMLGHATPFSRKIYSTIKEANPALWRRRDDIMINAPYHDYISAVYISDLRSDKEGEAYVVAGGIGQKTVTIALKSPSILTGYKFAIEIYGDSINSYVGGGVVGTPVARLSGIGGYPSTYPVNSVSYPTGGVQYPIGGVYPQGQYPIGR